MWSGGWKQRQWYEEGEKIFWEDNEAVECGSPEQELFWGLREQEGICINKCVCVCLFRSFHSGGISLETKETLGVPWGTVSSIYWTCGERVKYEIKEVSPASSQGKAGLGERSAEPRGTSHLGWRGFRMRLPAQPPSLTALAQEGKLYFVVVLSGPRTAGQMLPKLMRSPFLLPAKLQGPQRQRRATPGTIQGVWLEGQGLPFRVCTNSASCRTLSSTTMPCLFRLLAEARLPGLYFGPAATRSQGSLWGWHVTPCICNSLLGYSFSLQM